MKLWPRARPASGGYLCGKHPSAGDFVRVATGSADAAFVLNWLSQVHASRLELPNAEGWAPVRYFIFLPRPTRTFAGVIVPSRDSVGREFPLSLGGQFDIGHELPPLGTVPISFRRFFESAEYAATHAARSGVPDPRDLLARLPGVGKDAILAAAREERELLGSSTAHDFIRRGIGEGGAEHVAFALHVINRARGDGGRRVDAAERHLACPAGDEQTRIAWLHLLDLALDFTDTGVSLAWKDTPDARLIVGIGGSSAGLVRYALGEAEDSPDFWPLSTERAAALEAAERAMGAHVRRALDAELSTAAWVEAAAKITKMEPGAP